MRRAEEAALLLRIRQSQAPAGCSEVAALLWVLWHHQGASSDVGQAIRHALGMSQHQRMSPEQVASVRRYEQIRRMVRLPDPQTGHGLKFTRWSLE